MTTEVLVVGARGRVGREVLRALSATGPSVRALVRTPSPQGATLAHAREVVGDLRDRASLAAALDGVDAAFFVTPHAEDEEALGRGFIEAALEAKVRRLVFASAYHPDFSSKLGLALFVGAMDLFTHYGPKLRVERRVRLSAASPVVLMPSNFYQNDELFLDEIRAGSYPQPLGLRGVNRVDCRDIGDAAARALTDASIEAGAYPLVGAEPALTGPECAAMWADALGREVAYDGDIDRWYALVADRMHAREREDFKKTYKIFRRTRIVARPGELARVEALLGHAPRSYRTYVAERAATLR
ncbi:MAG TPA: NmrA family NAD(P)-binding protein [Kofleriaceae bacterium]|nr:NmrA family NAD(P)-binding protein [Kofleriaceae bacterium]